MLGSEPLGDPQEKGIRKREEKKKQGLVKVTEEGKCVIFSYFWLQSLFLIMYSPNSWLPWYRAVTRKGAE